MWVKHGGYVHEIHGFNKCHNKKSNLHEVWINLVSGSHKIVFSGSEKDANTFFDAMTLARKNDEKLLELK